MIPAPTDLASITRMLRVVPGAMNACAYSQGGPGNPVPVGNDRVEHIDAIGKLLDKRGRILGWVYRTDENTLLIQTVAPPIGQNGFINEAHEYSGYDRLTTLPNATLVPCTRDDFRNTRKYPDRPPQQPIKNVPTYISAASPEPADTNVPPSIGPSGIQEAAHVRCDASIELARRYRHALGSTPSMSWRLSGTVGQFRVAGQRGARGYHYAISFEKSVDDWGSDHRTIWHRLPNGFVGYGDEIRRRLDISIERFLNGTLFTDTSADSGCLRMRSGTYSVREYRPRGAPTVRVAFDQKEAVPVLAFVEPSGAHVRISNLGFTATRSGQLISAWSMGGAQFDFTNVAQLETFVTTMPPAARLLPIRQFADVRLHEIKNASAATIGVKIASKPVRLLFDTGAAILVLNPAAVSGIQVTSLGSHPWSNVLGQHDAKLVRIPLIRIGDIQIRDEVAIVSDQTFGYDGLIGSSLLARADVVMDGPARLLHVRPGQKRAGGSSLDTYDGIPIVRGNADRQFGAVVDSGVETSFVIPNSAISARSRRAGECRAKGLPPYSLFHGVVARAAIGPWRVERFPICIAYVEMVGESGTGLVGYPFLRKRAMLFSYTSRSLFRL